MLVKSKARQIFPHLYESAGIRGTSTAAQVVDGISLALTMLFVNGNLFLASYSPVPLPLITAVPLFRYFIYRPSLDQLFRVLSKGWLMAIIIFPLVSSVFSPAEGIADLLTALILLSALILFVDGRSTQLALATWIYFAVLASSSFLHLMQIFEIQWSIGLYKTIYTDLYRDMGYLNGFSPSIFHLGYQIAALLPASVIILLYGKSYRIRSVGLTMLVIAFWSLVFAGQRSALFGSIVMVGIVLTLTSGKRWILIILLLLIFNFASVPRIEVKTSANLNVFQKIETLDAEADTRVVLQKQALRAIAENPLGLIWSVKDWEDYALEVVTSENVISPHNAYLQHILKWGWLFAIPILGALAAVAKAGWHVIRVRDDSQSYLQLALFTAMGALLINAAFHNSSLFNINGATWTAYCLFWLWYENNNRKNSVLLSPV